MRLLRRIVVAVPLLAIVPASGCGSRDFRREFPADTTLENSEGTQILKAAHFTFDRSDNPNTGNRADTGKVTVTFGDAEERFEIPGNFTLTEMHNTTQPYAKLTVTYAVTEKARAQYQELIKRLEAEAKPGAEGKAPKELPSIQVFRAQLRISGGSQTRVELTDESGMRIVLERPKAKK